MRGRSKGPAARGYAAAPRGLGLWDLTIHHLARRFYTLSPRSARCFRHGSVRENARMALQGSLGSSRPWLSHVQLRCLVLGGVPDQFWISVRRCCNPLALVADLFVCILRLFVHRNDVCGPSRSVCIQTRPVDGIINRQFGRFRVKCDLVFLLWLCEGGLARGWTTGQLRTPTSILPRNTGGGGRKGVVAKFGVRRSIAAFLENAWRAMRIHGSVAQKE